MSEASTVEPDPVPTPRKRGGLRMGSAAWTVALIVFLFLPYRWLWLPCALAATMLVIPSKRSPSEVVRSNETLIFGSAMVLVLRTALDPMWWLPWILILAAIYWLRGHSPWPTWLSLSAIPLIWLAASLLLARPVGLRPFPGSDRDPAKDAVLVCAGDSLTSGLSPKSDDETYVGNLRKRLPCHVINAGVANDKTADLLARVDQDVIRRKPTAALVFIGGNDFLDGTPRSKFAQQFEALVSRIAAAGPKVVIVEVPTGIIWNPYAGIYRKVAARHGAILAPESKLRLWFSLELLAREHLSTPLTLDGIHLSPAGAAKVADWLEPYVRRALAER